MHKGELICRYAAAEEEKYILANILDRYSQCEGHNIAVCSVFLSSGTLTRAVEMLNSEHIPHDIYGGYEESERNVICFLPDYYTIEDISSSPAILDICCLEVKKDKFFKAVSLNHRDYLGALLNLGIERDVIGDIVINGDCAYIVCFKTAAEYIKDNLTRVGRCKVEVVILDNFDLKSNISIEEGMCNLSSLRLDAFIAGVFKFSRTAASESITKGIVCVNGIYTTDKTYIVKENDRISLKGNGKVVFYRIKNKTKKERLNCIIGYYK